MEVISTKNKRMPFQNDYIRVIQDVIGRTLEINLNDVCRLLKRSEMIDSGEIKRICRSNRQVQIRQGGKMYVYTTPDDILKLLNQVKQESGLVKPICKELEKWIENLPQPQMTDVYYPVKRTVQPVNEPVIYTYNDHPITFKQEGGKTYVNVKEMANYFQQTPAPWTRLAEVKNKYPDMEERIITVRGVKGSTWFDAEMAKDYAKFLSPDTDFYEWVCNHIKRINESGTLSQKSCVPDEEEWEWYETAWIAMKLRISVQRLNKYLCEKNICRKKGKTYVVNPGYMNLLTTVPYLYEIKGKVRSPKQNMRWNQLGLEYIKNEWDKDHRNLINNG